MKTDLKLASMCVLINSISSHQINFYIISACCNKMNIEIKYYSKKYNLLAKYTSHWFCYIFHAKDRGLYTVTIKLI